MLGEGRGASHTIAEFLTGYESEGRLRGFRCRACGARTATWGVACARCGADALEEAALGDHGTVVAATIVEVPSEAFVNDAPYAYVVVELLGGGRVSGWVPGIASLEEVAPGTPVRFRPSYKPGVQFERTEAAGP
jgi:uncharacterized OB-fold protein